MIDGQQISDARQRAGLTQQDLATKVGVSLRTVGNWERGATVPRSRMHALRAALSDHLGEPSDIGLRAASDAELLAEIARRFERGYVAKAGDGSGDAASSKDAGETPAEELSAALLSEAGAVDLSGDPLPEEADVDDAQGPARS